MNRSNTTPNNLPLAYNNVSATASASSTQTSNFDGHHLNKNESGGNLGKRKKTTKSKQKSIVPRPNKSLDDWLENCLKDSFTTPTTTSDYIDSNINAMISPKISSTTIPQLLLNANFMDSNLVQQQRTYLQSQLPNPTTNYFTQHMMLKNPNYLQAQFNPDFTSLPPAVNFDNESSEQKLSDGNLQMPILNEKRRFSDPGMAGNSDESKDSETSSQTDSNMNNANQSSENSKLLTTLLEQINLLHETNSKICRNLHETKVEIEALKHAPSWGLRHRRDSISGLSTHSQPLGYAFGTQSPAPTYHSGAYTPGMLTDVVREVREGARIREEALINRVKSMVEERSWSLNEANFRMARDMEEMKLQMQQLKIDKKETANKVFHLENEIKSLKVLLSHTLNYYRPQLPNNSNELDAIKHNPDKSSLHENVSKTKRHSLSLNYGIINQDDGVFNTFEQEILRPANQKYSTPKNQTNSLYTDNHISNTTLNQVKFSQQQSQTPVNSSNQKTNNSLEDKISNDPSSNHLVQLEKDTLELRRELQDAIAGKKQAESRIFTLEKIVTNLQSKITSTANNDFHEAAANSLPNGAHCVKQDNDSANKSNTITTSQIASQIQTVSPKSNFCLTGPVTDL